MRIFYILRTQTGKTSDFIEQLCFNSEYVSQTSQTSQTSQFSYNCEEISDDFSKPSKGF
jgi:hypothetical protein